MTDTSVTQYLDQQGVSYTLLPHQTPAVSIEDAARQRGISPSIMLKTMLLRDMGGLMFVACVPGDQQVDPKKVRAHFECKRVTCVGFEEVQSITGYKPGTLTPFHLTHDIKVIFDRKILELPQVTISSGTDMAGVLLNTQDMLELCTPHISDIVRYK
ncbi:transcriptional regulator [Vibrio sp. JCM 19236]|nr:transcriptional regulator [Vibrio sp. JCM 19236]